MKDAVDQLVASGTARGSQVAVYRHSEPIVDDVAGVADSAPGRPMTSDTPLASHSTGEAASATSAHLLVEPLATVAPTAATDRRFRVIR